MIAGILAILAIILSIGKIIKIILVKYIGHALILGAQFTITALTIIFVMVFYTFTITALVSIFNLGVDIFTYASTADSSMVSCMFGYMDCVGITPALQNGFTMAYGVLSTVVIFHLMKFTYSAMKIIGNELFKLGLLLGQALN